MNLCRTSPSLKFVSGAPGVSKHVYPALHHHGDGRARCTYATLASFWVEIILYVLITKTYKNLTLFPQSYSTLFRENTNFSVFERTKISEQGPGAGGVIFLKL